MRFEAFLDEQLSQMKAAHLLRVPDDGLARKATLAAAAALGESFIDASSNDYLGLAAGFVSRETSAAGAGASRLIHGTAPEHQALERELAAWVSTPSALLFSSAYAANLGLVSALGTAGTVIISDASNHASLIDGARLAKAQVVVVPHLDLDAIDNALGAHRSARACWVLVESYFSMDGDGPDLSRLRTICDAQDACLVVDEAHALGVFGPRGAGRCAEHGVRPDILIGALGKAVGSHGGFVAGSTALRSYLWNRARSFVFSTAPSPRLAALSLEQVRGAQEADEARKRLLNNAAALREKLLGAGLEVARNSFGPIVSIVLGDNERVLAAAANLRAAGILVQAIRAPTVALGAARLRLTVKSTFELEDVKRLASAVEAACRA